MACLMVLYSHLPATGYLPKTSVNFGGLGVMLFFVLSGFLMGYLYLEKTKLPDLVSYAVKRFFRVYPLYFIASLALFCVVATIGIEELPGSRLQLPTYNFDYLIKQLTLEKGFGGFWTIPVEMHFYVLFALIMLISLKHWPIRFIAIFAATLVAFASYSLPATAHEWVILIKYNSYAVMWDFMGIFLCGAYFGAIYRKWPDGGYLQLIISKLSNLITIIIFVCFIVASNILFYWQEFPVVSWGNSMVISLLLSFYVLTCAVSSSAPSQLINNRFLRFTGKISFSLYILHIFTFSLIVNNYLLAPWIGIPLLIISSYVCAILSYQYIEKPGIRIGQHFNDYLLCCIEKQNIAVHKINS